MAAKNKFDYEVEEFKRNFKGYQDKRIAIYGIGRMTAALLEQIEGFQIVGLLDKDKSLVGMRMYGLPIIDRDMAEKETDLVIINTSEAYWNTIYNRISDWNIPIYFRNGQQAQKTEYDWKKLDYWKKTYSEMVQLAESHEVLSFDIFDTLLMRKVVLPIDVFEIVKGRIEKTYADDFVQVRQRAATLLTEPTIDEIYVKIQEITNWENDIIQEMKNIEIEADMDIIVPRYKMIDFCKRFLGKKDVYFVSDMYYTSDILLKILAEVGLEVGQEQILVSCEYKKSKKNGDLWQYYKNEYVKNRTALHIGDNKKADIEKAENEGIDAFYVMNAYTMLKNSSMCRIVSDICSLYASKCVGLICSKIFNDPFVLSTNKGTIMFADNKEAGYCMLGAFQFSFMTWLMNCARRDGVDVLAFLSRDGYLLKPQYEYLCKLLEENELPRAVYLEISRRAIMNASIENAEDIYDIMQYPYSGTVNELFLNRFGIITNLEEISVNDLSRKDPGLKNTIGSMKDEILAQSGRERKTYLKYLDEMQVGDNFAVVDTMLYGTNQYYLGKLLDRRLKGYYFCAFTESDAKNLQRNDMYGCFQKEDDKAGRNTYIWKNNVFTDAFYCAPVGMLLYIDEEGNKVYAPQMSNQKTFQSRLEMQEGIFEFMEDMLKLHNSRKLEDVDSDNYFADELLGLFLNAGFKPSEELKKSFFFDNALLNNAESPLWE